ncbi:extracellular solute-binding protein [Brevibacillus borstelensis]|uniref:extracellular solute-binding protein n=1 Tax=Brevibacillus borstelensis TaxID=45462 RepID=UPI001837337D|nr:extracellular solute-binding protein [Brevibacillus borstelensis]MCM3621665.1 extracellular solute-binding protein [Brevibacillus borstelensis]MED1851797.1 extracellular solute-binding protein [Brevibacillus borstelensis]MED2010149.1 extracellular solute-binding protein [Brevibacillus borstelensis]NOU55755.1 extracellular solute-binding protein [Brevibacillus borstelensis]
MRLKRLYVSFFAAVLSLLLAACSQEPSAATQSSQQPPAGNQQQATAAEPRQPAAPESKPSESSAKEIVLATTTSTQDSGLLDVMLPAFEQKSGIKVKVVAVGTGQAIKLGEDGNADVLLVHSRKAEDEFVSKGFGTDAYDVMYNQFYIVGPADDPAGAKTAKTAAEAFALIAEKKAPFISRGDDSGTDKKEKSIWKEAKLTPEGDWYLSSGQGMGATLQMADEKNAYTLTDEATYLSRKLNLQVVMQGDQSLLNPYGIIKVKSTSKPDEAMQFIQFFTGEEGQKIIGEFGKDKYGKGLFVPSAKKR